MATRLQNPTAILLLLLLCWAADAYYIQSQGLPGHQMGGQAMLAQGGYPQHPMMMGGPFLGGDIDQPDVPMYGMPPGLGFGGVNYVAYPGSVPGVVPSRFGQPAMGMMNQPRVTVHQPGVGGVGVGGVGVGGGVGGGTAHQMITQPHLGVVNHPHTVVQPGAGTVHHTVAQSHVGAVSHSTALQPGPPHSVAQPHGAVMNPATMVQAGGGGQRRVIAQAHAGNPTVIHSTAGAQPRVGAANAVVDRSHQHPQGGAVNPPVVQQTYGAGSHQVVQHAVNPAPPVNLPGPQYAQSVVHKIAPSSRGAVPQRVAQPNAIPTARVLVNPRPNPTGASMTAVLQPGAVPVGYRRTPQRVQTARLRSRGLVGLRTMPGGGLGLRQGGLGMRRPFPRDGTYKTARGEYTRDGSDLSFEPRY